MKNNNKKVHNAEKNQAEKHPKWALETQTEGLDETKKEKESEKSTKNSDCGCKYF